VYKKFPLEKKGPSAGTGDDTLAASCRGKKCVALAKMKTSESWTRRNPFMVPVSSTAVPTTARIKKSCSPSGQARAQFRSKFLETEEMGRSLIVKICNEPIGSGTFGDCFLADYHGIKVVVKEMKRRDQPLKETEWCKKEASHEAKVLNSLGDHEGLLFLLGICREKEPYSLVTQFHGSREESLTLHNTIQSKKLNKIMTSETFTRISTTLEYIHSKGYLHNDLESNNVLLERRNDCFRPVIIDFGKSKQIAKVGQSSRNSKIRRADYIAPEVRNGFKETTANDVYSLGKMLKRTVFGRSFSNLFSSIIFQTTIHLIWTGLPFLK
jgi:tRNA A-37 threonylcarbamoyl transferase component Bud32